MALLRDRLADKLVNSLANKLDQENQKKPSQDEVERPLFVYSNRDANRAIWPASLTLNFSGGEFGTRLKSAKHLGPLYVQKAFYPEGEDTAHVYLLHPPGGVVSGDTLTITVEQQNNAHTLITTPGAARLYRARQDAEHQTPLPQKVTNHLSLSEQSFLEWLPCETIIFDGAQIDLTTRVHMDQSSTFCGWEITCLGLPVSEAPFLTGKCRQRFEIIVADNPVFIDTLMFNGDSPLIRSLSGLQGKPVFGTFVAGPHFLQEIDVVVPKLRDALSAEYEESIVAVTAYQGFIVVRYLGHCSDQAKKCFILAWETLRPMLIDRPAVHPRIWAT